MFQAYDWEIDEESEELSIICWCLNDKNISCCLRIQGFSFYGFVEHQRKDEIMRILRPDHCEKRLRKKLYFYSEKETEFYLVTYRSREKFEYAIKKCREMKWNFYEYSISPILKLLSLKNIGFSSWIEVKNEVKVVSNKISTLTEEFLVSYDEIFSSQKARDSRPKIFSFDIECYSENLTSIPEPIYAQNTVIMISIVFQVYKEPSTRKKIIITRVPCEVKDTEKVICKDEIDLINTFQDFIISLDPDIIIGFNIFGFDFPYLHTRLQIHLENWKPIGRIKDKIPTLKDISWESSAYGEQKMKILTINGRLCLDLLRIISRDYKLPQYNLNTVAKEFLKRTKHNIHHTEIFRAYYQHLNNNTDVSKFSLIAEYCLEDSNLVMDLFHVLELWIGLTEMSNIVHVPIMDLFTHGQQIKCFSQIYHMTSQMKYIINPIKEPYESFAGADVVNPIVGLHDYVICLDFKSLYPSIIISKNICYTTFCIDEKIPDEDCNIIEWEETEKNKKYRFRFYKKQEGILPKILRELINQRNQVKKLMSTEKDPLMKVIYDKRQWALKISANAFFGFLGTRDKGKLPLLPASMSITAEGRKTIQRCQEFLRKRYGAKIIYGDTDSVFFNLECIQSVSDLFEKGKEITQEINKEFHPLEIEFEKCGRMLCISKKYYVFWGYNEKTKDFLWNNVFYSEMKGVISENTEVIVNGQTAKIKDIQFKDKIEVYETNGEKITIEKRKVPSMLFKGVALARRDKCLWTRRLFEIILDKIIQKQGTMEEVYEIIQNYILRICRKQVNIEELFTIKGVKVYYKNNNAFKILTERLKKNGYVIDKGARLEFIVVPGNERVGERMIIREEVEEMKKKGQEIAFDKIYYVQLLVKHIENLFQVGFQCNFHESLLKFLGRKYKKIGMEKVIRELRKRFKSDEIPERLTRIEVIGKKIAEDIRKFEKSDKIYLYRPVTNMITLIENRQKLNEEFLSNLHVIYEKFLRDS